MAESEGAFKFYLQETFKDLSENSKQINLKPEKGAAIKSLVHGQDVLVILAPGFDVNKIDRPNMTPTVRAICTFAVFVASLLFMKGISYCVKRRKLKPLDPAKAYCKRS